MAEQNCLKTLNTCGLERYYLTIYTLLEKIPRSAMETTEYFYNKDRNIFKEKNTLYFYFISC